MEHHLQSLQSFLGYVSSGGRFIRLLVDGWSLSECGRVEDGPLLPFFFCGACGGNVMIDSSRTKKELLRNSFHFSSILCTLGRPRSSYL
jgi:hypothetical protein